MEVARLNTCVSLPVADDEVVVDSMLGWLVRWLRMLGVRAVYSPNFSDNELLGVNQLLVTRDKELFRKRTRLSLLLITTSRVEWLSILSLVLSFPLSLDMNRSLCPVCGSRLIKVSREAVINKVPNNVLLRHSDFWLCTGCGRVYWVGSHHARIRRELEIARGILSELKVSCVNNNLLIFHE
ncbi:Mut7-C RNAse domain-containing protein [Vulcanisaeta souniana]|uniref:DNA-binding protein n=1 Tax=Vulcanisaeta souniana JCM 11219 TaxID=1293586 RepID=A0A830DZL7_9CREN|nr:Mut7-C RNAse domain-containing protein [Vulcanisaeta souniana]GGI68114.1 DNA-binding protein [Vulcanisaeta souniana JCM 11219]